MKVLTSTGLRKLIELIKSTFIKTEDVDEAILMDVDANPTSGSEHLVTSGGVYTALSGKQNASDNSLQTTSKNVVGAINELNVKVGGDVYEFIGEYEVMSSSGEIVRILKDRNGNNFSLKKMYARIELGHPYDTEIAYYYYICPNGYVGAFLPVTGRNSRTDGGSSYEYLEVYFDVSNEHIHNGHINHLKIKSLSPSASDILTNEVIPSSVYSATEHYTSITNFIMFRGNGDYEPEMPGTLPRHTRVYLYGVRG